MAKLEAALAEARKRIAEMDKANDKLLADYARVEQWYIDAFKARDAERAAHARTGDAGRALSERVTLWRELETALREDRAASPRVMLALAALENKKETT